MRATPLEAPSPEGRSVRLFVRAATAVPEQRASVIDRLERLADEPVITAFDVEPWPKAVSVAIAERWNPGSPLDIYRAFEEWASDHGVEISPPFARRVYQSTITRSTDERLVTPELALAVFEEGELTAVYPYRDGGSSRTVRDGLDALSVEQPLPNH